MKVNELEEVGYLARGLLMKEGMKVKVKIYYNRHRYQDCSDTSQTCSRHFVARDMDSALGKFYDWRREENERAYEKVVVTFVGMLTGKDIVDVVE